MPQTRKTLCQTLEYPQIRDTAKLAIPAILYFIQNMLVQHAASNLPAALFQVTSQGKTLIVAVLAIGVLGKIITRAQWLSICLMAIGLVTVQMANTSESSQKSMKNSAEQSVKTGLILILLGSFCSAFASVYFEKMMKTPTGMRAPSIWLRNIQLAMCSAIIGGVAVTLFDSEKAVFHGFNGHVWFMIVNNAVGGLFVAMAINYAGNVAKGFTYAVATVLTCLLSVPLLGFSVDAYFFCGMLLVCWSCLLYSGSVRIPVFTEWWGREPVLCGQVRKTSAGELITLAQGKVGQSSAIELKTQSALAVTV